MKQRVQIVTIKATGEHVTVIDRFYDGIVLKVRHKDGTEEWLDADEVTLPVVFLVEELVKAK